MSLILAISIIFHLLRSTKGQTDDFFEVCPPSQCVDKGPLIRFPFRLDSQPSSCGLKGYELSSREGIRGPNPQFNVFFLFLI
ncbi:hypothetical protein QJS10_CPB14g00253 [Acorus calamus]|uniref:Secreted protein n=1 Tax=Acorus calamus TaxID=4465 RepID=A0AAV9D9J3_ACOCL|nr:hypothetical protein QJS10_CPB14g00232 [Acorus calamus]KAK1299236.1 hypothetical protein QJS10_CPB14g00253 [Acorus calamus]